MTLQLKLTNQSIRLPDLCNNKYKIYMGIPLTLETTNKKLSISDDSFVDILKQLGAITGSYVYTTPI